MNYPEYPELSKSFQETQPDIPVVPDGHVASAQFAGPSTAPFTVPNELTTDEEPEELLAEEEVDPPARHRRVREFSKLPLLFFPIGAAIIALAFWGIRMSSEASDSRSHGQRAIVTPNPSVSPGPTVTQTVRGPRVVVTQHARAAVTVRVTVTETRRQRVTVRPKPSISTVYSSCPQFGCS